MRSRLALLVLALVTWPCAVRTADDSVTGRWVFDFDVTAYERGTPMVRGPLGAGSGAPAATPPKVTRAVLDLTALPGGALIGTVTGIQSTQGSGAGFAPVTVEIAEGTVVSGAQVSFRVWRYDQVTNLMKVDGRVVGETLELTISRVGTPPYSATVTATRLSRRVANAPMH